MNKPNHDALNLVIADCAATVDELYGHYLDSVCGFQKIYEFLVDGQNRARSQVPPGTDLDEAELFLGIGDVNDPSHYIQHRTTQGCYKTRNARGGPNYIRAAQLLVVLIYSFWETRYRSNITDALGLRDVNDLKIPLMGDLRRLRHDIVHHTGRLQKKNAEKLEIITHFKDGDEIILSEVDVFLLVQKVKAALDSIAVEAGGPDPQHRTVWQIHGSTLRAKSGS